MQKEKVSTKGSDVKAAKATDIKSEVKEAVAAVKETAKKTETAAKKAGRKAAGKKKDEPKAAPKTNVVVQVLNQEFDLSDLEAKVKAQFVADGHRAGCIKLLEIYAKPEEGKAYYVVNEGKFTGSVDL